MWYDRGAVDLEQVETRRTPAVRFGEEGVVNLEPDLPDPPRPAERADLPVAAAPRLLRGDDEGRATIQGVLPVTPGLRVVTAQAGPTRSGEFHDPPTPPALQLLGAGRDI